MKKYKNIKLVCLGMFGASLLFANESDAQVRKLPDGTIIYNDGSRKLPNGTVVYSNGKKVDNRKTGVVLSNGTVVYPERERRNRGIFGTTNPTVNRNERRLPPGQAKKIYGGSAKDYAPGQQKKLRNRNGQFADANYYNEGKRGKKAKHH